MNGSQMLDLAKKLYPICRSITGNGVRESLRIIGEHIPLTVHELPTGTQVFDWEVPREWNITDAWIKGPDGDKIVDIKRHNLHVVSYSVPVRSRLTLNELKPHLHSLPDKPELIPYRTSYYNDSWGFCLPHRQLEQLRDGDYEVCIESSLIAGSLTYGEYVMPGESDDIFLFSCHCCHPSLANDNISGMVLATSLAKFLSERKHRYTYRFVFVPGTIGAISWLSQNQTIVPRIKHGLVIACVGDDGKMHYKRSRRGNAEIDRAVEYVFRHSGESFELHDFSPYGYDERQYNSPGFNLPVGSLTRTPHGKYPEYHTSADNLDLLDRICLDQSLDRYRAVIDLVERNKTYFNTNPHCEPQLGKRGLYRATGGHVDAELVQMALLWVLNQSDGSHSLLDIAVRSGLEYDTIAEAADLLLKTKLLREVPRA